MAYAPVQVRSGVYQLKEGNKTRNLFLIHGLWGDGAFNADGDQMRAFYEQLESEDAFGDHTVWALSYNTVFMPFDISGAWLAKELRQLEGYDFSNALVVGYSMGGLIARSLISNGFDFKYLVTIDTPHHGPVQKWNTIMWGTFLVSPLTSIVNMVVHGIDSLIWGSGSHNFIHSSALDKAKRKTSYAFYGIDHQRSAETPFAGDDGVVPVASQLGLDVGEVRWRALWHKTYTDEQPWKDNEPHGTASYPEHCREVLDLVKSLLAGNPMPARTLEEKPTTSPIRTESYLAGKLPLDIQEWKAWYWFDKQSLPQVRVRLRVENKDTKPVRVPFSAFFKTDGGAVRALEPTSELLLPPRKVRDIVFAIEHPVSEVMPEELEVVSFGERKKLPLLFVPLELDVTSPLPTESLWQLGLTAKATSTSSEDGYFTEVTVQLTVDNPSPSAFYLDHRSVDIRSDVTSQPYYGLLSHSDVSEEKRVRIAPATQTSLTLVAQWARGVGRPNKVKVVLGGDMMPAAELEVAAT